MDTELLQYRLKSARRKKRLVKEDRDKQLLKLDRERTRITNDPDYNSVIPLDEPYQKGWKRLFVLKPEVQKSAKADFYQQILNKINTVRYHYDRSFKKPKRRRWQRFNYEDLPTLNIISRYDWNINKHQLSEEQRACFERVDFWNDQRYAMDYCYRFTQPELFEIVVRPHIIDTVKVGDALLEQRIAWINNHIDNHHLQSRLQKLHKGGWNNRWKRGTEKLKYLNPLKNKRTDYVLEE